MGSSGIQYGLCVAMMIVVCKVYSLPVSYCCAWLAKKSAACFTPAGKAPAHMQNSWRWMMQRTRPAAQAQYQK